MAVDATTGPHDEPRFDPNGAPEDWVDLAAVADYASLVGNTKIGTRANRLTLTGKKVWEGLWYGETDGDFNVFRYLSGGWKFISSPRQTTAGLVYNASWGNASSMELSKLDGRVSGQLSVSKVGAINDGDSPGAFPAGFRPTVERRGAGQFAGSGTPVWGGYSISTAGVVSLSGVPGSHNLFFAEVEFRVPTPT